MYISVRDGKMVGSLGNGLGKRSKQVGLTPKTFLYVVDTLNYTMILLQLILQFGWLQFCYNSLTHSLDWNLMNHNPSHIFHMDLNQMNHNQVHSVKVDGLELPPLVSIYVAYVSMCRFADAL